MEIIYVLVGYNYNLNQMEARYWRVSAEVKEVLMKSKLLLKLEGDYASSVLWKDIPEDLFSTPVWVDGSPSTLGEERLHFM